MTHVKIVLCPPCPECGNEMFLREPHQRSAGCAACGYSRRVRKTHRDGKIIVSFVKPPSGKTIQFRVTVEQWQALGGAGANQAVKDLAIDSLAGKM